MAEIIINDHRVDLEYVGFSFVIEDMQNGPMGYAPMIRVDGQRVRLGHELYPAPREARIAVRVYLGNLANPSRPDEDTALT